MIKRLFRARAQKVVQWVIVGWGLAYFGTKIAVSGFSFRGLFVLMGEHAGLMALQVGLLCLNFVCEAQKWRGLMLTVGCKIPMTESLMTSIKASALGNATLGGLGEHVARVGEGEDRRQRLRLSVLSSVVQNIVIGGFGLAAMLISGEGEMMGCAAVVAVAVLAGLFVWLYGYRAKGLPWLRETLAAERIGRGTMLGVFGWNVLRYLTFSLQLYLFLSWAEVPIWDLAPRIGLYYLVITLMPTMRLADVGIKGSTALFVFSPLLDEVMINNGIMAIWLLNTLVPTAVGFALVVWGRRK